MTSSRTVAAPAEPDRWPQSVYGVGSEPDPRFTFANQRTLLAWVRTGLAYIVAGAMVDLAPVPMPPLARAALAVLLSIAGVVCVIHGWRSWKASEIAMREERPLPSNATPSLYLIGTTTAAALVVSLLATIGF